MKIHFLISVIFASAYYSYAEENKVKAIIIEEIMGKVANMTSNILANAPADKKTPILGKINHKLLKTAEGLKDGKKYVHLIMQELMKKISRDKNTPTTPRDITVSNKSSIYRTRSALRDNFKENINLNILQIPKAHLKIDNLTKQHIINDIAKKIQSMAKGYLRGSQSMAQKEKILQKIKDRILESSKQKHTQIHNQHSELKAYTDLIAQGFDLSLKRLLLSKTYHRRSGKTMANGTHIENIESSETHVNIIEHIYQYNMFFSEIWNTSLSNGRCAEVVDEICDRMGYLSSIRCEHGHVISVEQLCDGVADCWNEADELNCTTQATNKIREAIFLLSDIVQLIPGKCLFEGDIFTFNNQGLLDKLRARLKFLQTYSPPTKLSLADQDEVTEITSINPVNEVREEMSLLSFMFEGNLCPFHVESLKKHNLTRKNFPFEARFEPEDKTILDDIMVGKDTRWSPTSCTCEDKLCKSHDCDPRCNRICWQRYNLQNWECKSISGDSSISFNLLCDGKLDCFDESDENGCTSESSLTRYEANNLYKQLIDILSLKSLSLEYENSRNKIRALLTIVRQLQSFTTKSPVDVYAVKELRDQYFKLLVLVYEDMLNTAKQSELEQSYEFLHVIKRIMLNALRRSHTGNDQIVTSLGCFCNNGKCALVRCRPKCVATCLIEPVIMKFHCNARNESVSLKNVCDGKKECSNNEDENDCQKEVCRSHHLVLLRHNLQKVEVKYKGSAMEEVFDTWKSKVFSTLAVAQHSEQRPTQVTILNIVTRLLHDLVTAYGAMEEPKRFTPEMVINEFRNISNVVKNTLKLCGA